MHLNDLKIKKKNAVKKMSLSAIGGWRGANRPAASLISSLNYLSPVSCVKYSPTSVSTAESRERRTSVTI